METCVKRKCCITGAAVKAASRLKKGRLESGKMEFMGGGFECFVLIVGVRLRKIPVSAVNADGGFRRRVKMKRLSRERENGKIQEDRRKQGTGGE